MQKNTVNLIVSVVVVAILAAVVFVLGAITSWFKDWSRFTNAFESAGTSISDAFDTIGGDEEEQPEEKAEDRAISVTPLESVSMRMTALNSSPDLGPDKCLLTVVPVPANASETRAEWSVRWTDPSDEWAVGKTASDYVSLSSEVGSSVVLTCEQRFGAEITVRARIYSAETSYSATAVVNCARRFDDFFVYRYSGVNERPLNDGGENQVWYKDQDVHLMYHIDYGADYIPSFSTHFFEPYTYDHIYGDTINVEVSGELLNALAGLGVTCNPRPGGAPTAGSDRYYFSPTAYNINRIIGAEVCNTEVFGRALRSVENHLIVTARVSNGASQDVTKTYTVSLDVNSFGIPLESISLNDGHVTF